VDIGHQAAFRAGAFVDDGDRGFVDAPPLLSVTAPAIPPPNDCAEATLAIARKVPNILLF
jgi:hypothetical protein